MNLSYFISGRIEKNPGKSFSSVIHKIAVSSIAIGLAIMLLAFMILYGFQENVRNRLFSISSHFTVNSFTLGNTFEEKPVSKESAFYQHWDSLEYVAHVQEFSYKAGLIRTKEEVQGIVFKGVGTDFDTTRFLPNLIEGRFVHPNDSAYSKEVLISQVIANKMRLSVGDDMVLHFFMNPPRVRKLKIVGLYDTNLSDYFDNRFIIGDIGLIRRLNNWPDSLTGGFEVFIDDFTTMEQADVYLDEHLASNLFIEKVTDKYSDVFDWLIVIARQVNMFLVIILIVVCVNMVSVILVLIMERTPMIGLLKAMGADNQQVRKIFSYSGLRLIWKGLLIGNILALSLAAIQYYFRVIPLNPHDYYISYVPIMWKWDIILLANIGTFVLVYLILIVPTLVIAKINPIKSMKFN